MSDAELRRRLTAIADLATVDGDDGWEELQHRLGEAAQPSTKSRAATPRLLLAVAAAVAGLVLATYVLTHRTDDDRLRTVDEDTTTTTTEDPRSSSTTTSSTTSPTATSAPATVPTGPGGPAGATPGSSTGSPTGSGNPRTTPSPPGTTPTTAPPPATVPGGAPVQLTYTASGYTLQGTFADVGSGRFEIDIWRAGQGQVGQLLLFNRPGQNCLAGGNATDLAFPEAGADIYTWGLVRSDAARVRVVTTDAQSTGATLGAEAYPGIRIWIARIPNDQIDRLEAVGGSGNLLHEAPWGANLDAYPDSC